MRSALLSGLLLSLSVITGAGWSIAHSPSAHAASALTAAHGPFLSVQAQAATETATAAATSAAATSTVSASGTVTSSTGTISTPVPLQTQTPGGNGSLQLNPLNWT